MYYKCISKNLLHSILTISHKFYVLLLLCYLYFLETYTCERFLLLNINFKVYSKVIVSTTKPLGFQNI